jgi:hypothetical protein
VNYDAYILNPSLWTQRGEISYRKGLLFRQSFGTTADQETEGTYEGIWLWDWSLDFTLYVLHISRVVPPTVLVIENVIICLLENLASARNSNEGKQECLQWGRGLQ